MKENLKGGLKSYGNVGYVHFDTLEQHIKEVVKIV